MLEHGWLLDFLLLTLACALAHSSNSLQALVTGRSKTLPIVGPAVHDLQTACSLLLTLPIARTEEEGQITPLLPLKSNFTILTYKWGRLLLE